MDMSTEKLTQLRDLCAEIVSYCDAIIHSRMAGIRPSWALPKLKESMEKIGKFVRKSK